MSTIFLSLAWPSSCLPIYISIVPTCASHFKRSIEIQFEWMKKTYLLEASHRASVIPRWCHLWEDYSPSQCSWPSASCTWPSAGLGKTCWRHAWRDISVKGKGVSGFQKYDATENGMENGCSLFYGTIITTVSMIFSYYVRELEHQQCDNKYCPNNSLGMQNLSFCQQLPMLWP